MAAAIAAAIAAVVLCLVMAAPALAADLNPDVAQYNLPLSTGQISNYREFVEQIPLNDQAAGLLRANGFVVLPDPFYPEEEQITSLYERLKEKEIPLFITTDSLLHLYHIQFDETLRVIEEQYFYADLWNISAYMLSRAEEDYNSTTGTAREAARTNMAFFAVGLSLLQPGEEQLCQGSSWECEDWNFEGGNPYFTREELDSYTVSVPPAVSGLVFEELELIEGHAGFSPSPIFGYQEDYSQYVPRGHYTRSEKLKNYFQAMMWYGRMGFLLKGCPGCLVSEGEAARQTLAAAMISRHLGSDPAAQASWDRIYNVTSFYVGYSDDLGPYEYRRALNELFGSLGPMAADLTPEDLGQMKIWLARQGRPRIYGGSGECLAGTAEQADQCLSETAGLRLMGQRFIPDSYLFQNLVFPYAGAYTGTGGAFTLGGTDRLIPRGLDVMYLLGSNRAGVVLAETNDSSYANYDSQMEMLKGELAAMEEAGREKNLYWAWLSSLKPLLESFEEGYPAFMRTSAWQDKELTTALASWTELRHDTILYAKQSYTVEAAAPFDQEEEEPEPVVGYVEPVPEFYRRLGNLTKLTREGLAAQGLLNGSARLRMDDLQEILQRLEDISSAELMGKELREEDYEFIRNFGSEINGVIYDMDEPSRRTTMVADVHTDSNTGQVLEEAVGYVRLMAVAYRLPDGRTLAGAGPVFSYYEFKQPMSDRLTDEAWRLRLRASPPAEPEWICSYAGWCDRPLTLPPDQPPSGSVSWLGRARTLIGI